MSPVLVALKANINAAMRQNMQKWTPWKHTQRDDESGAQAVKLHIGGTALFEVQHQDSETDEARGLGGHIGPCDCESCV